MLRYPFLVKDLSKATNWDNMHESFGLFELNKKYSHSIGLKYRRITALDQQNFFPLEKKLTPDGICLSQNDPLFLIDFKKISYPFNLPMERYLDNFFKEKEQSIYKYSLNLKNIETKVIINLGELPLEEKTFFLEYVSKLKNEGRLNNIFILKIYENEELLVTDVSNLEIFIMDYFKNNSPYFELLKKIENMSFYYQDIFDVIMKKMDFQRKNRIGLQSNDYHNEFLNIQDRLKNKGDQKYIENIIKESFIDFENVPSPLALPWY